VTIVVAAVAALILVVVLTTVALVAPRGVPGLKYYEVNAQFNDAAQIADLSEVRIAGRHVGQVKSSELRNGHATVQLQLFPGKGPVRSDATARIRLKGLLGAKFVDLKPGSKGKELASGSTLPARQTSTAVELLDVLQALDPPHRAQLQTTVKGLGEGFLSRGAGFNEYLRLAPDFYAGLSEASASILARKGAAARFAPSTESLAGAYDPVREELAAGFAPEARALEAFANSRPALTATLEEAPPSLEALRSGLDAATPMLNETAGLARATTRITRIAPAALRETSVFLRKGGPALRSSRPLLDQLAAAVPATVGFLKKVDPVIAPSTRALKNNVPGFDALGRHSCDVLNFGRNWRSTLGFGLATGVGDPIGFLDGGDQPGLGPLTSLRVIPVRLTELEALNADAPPVDNSIGRNVYPAPCVSISERYR
jgi:virulence factor Mce-like protein